MRALVVAMMCVSQIAYGSDGPEMPDVIVPADRAAALSGLGRRIAVVVGTSTYDDARWAALPNAVGDARALGDTLRQRYGYEVRELVGPDTTTLKSALRKAALDAGDNDDLLIFVSGHGHFDEDDSVGSLVMRDAARGCVSGCYPFDSIKRAIFPTRARHVLVLLDVCYGGTFDYRVAVGGNADAVRSDTLGLRRAVRDYARVGSRLVFASVGKALASDGPAGAHSPFARALLSVLRASNTTGVVELDDIFDVMRKGNDALPVQRPMSFESERAHDPQGTFLFIEQIDFCEAVTAIAQARATGFRSIAAGDERMRPYGTSWRASWFVPGTIECRVWRWQGHAEPQVRCEVGAFDEAVARARSEAMTRQVEACSVEHVRAITVCDEDCTVTLVAD